MRWRLSIGWQLLCVVGVPLLLFAGVWLAIGLLLIPGLRLLAGGVLLLALGLSAWILMTAYRRIQEWKVPDMEDYAASITDITDFQRLSPAQFEELVAYLFIIRGFQAQLVGRSGDHGIDIELYRNGHFWGAVQCKRYLGSVGEPLVRECYGSMCHRTRRGFLVTSGTFTLAARKWIASNQNPATELQLIDRADLIEQLTFYRWHKNLPPVTSPTHPTKAYLHRLFLDRSA